MGEQITPAPETAYNTLVLSKDESLLIKQALRAALQFIDLYGYRVDPEWAEEVERKCFAALAKVIDPPAKAGGLRGHTSKPVYDQLER